MIYFCRVLLGADQFLNALLNGNPDETLSSCVYREDRQWLVSIINTIFIDPNHCQIAYEYKQTYPRPSRQFAPTEDLTSSSTADKV